VDSGKWRCTIEFMNSRTDHILSAPPPRGDIVFERLDNGCELLHDVLRFARLLYAALLCFRIHIEQYPIGGQKDDAEYAEWPMT
jgi:hypothetical protein